MGRLQPFPIVGGAYTDDAKSWANQDTVNYLPVRSEREGTLTAAKLEQAPGLRPFLKLGNGPIRGGRDVEGKGFVVSGTSLYLISGEGVASAVGTIPGTGPVTITHNQITGGNQVVIGNGISGYVYDTSDNTLVQITDDGFPGFASLDFLGQMILGVEPQRRFWFHSDLVDAASYNTNNRYSAETSPDRLVGLIAAHNGVMVFGERTIEPWDFQPSANQNFQLQGGSVVEMGCAAARTLCRLDNSIFFLNNAGQVVQLLGTSPRTVSTRAMEGAISRCDLSRAFAFTWEDKGHAVYYITFPDGQTWGWDAAHGEWHRRKSYGMERWRLSCLFKLNGHWYGGDAFSGLLYRLTWRWAKEACDPVERIRRTGFVYQAAERFRVHRMQFELDAGGTETVPYHWPDDATPVVGALPELSVGVPVDFQYTVTPTPDRPFGMTVSGMPAGLTLHINGRVTGTPTSEGDSDVVITVVDDCGEPQTLEDEATVIVPPVEWLLFQASHLHKISPDGLDWSAAAQTFPLSGGGDLTPSSSSESLCVDGEVLFVSVALGQSGFRDADGVWWPITTSSLSASSGQLAHSGTHWFIAGHAGSVCQVSLNGKTFTDLSTNEAEGVARAGERMVFAYATGSTFGIVALFSRNRAGTDYVNMADLFVGYTASKAVLASDGDTLLLALQDRSTAAYKVKLHSSTDGGANWTAHGTVFPDFTSVELANGVDIHHDPTLGWFVSAGTRIARGATPGTIALDAQVFPEVPLGMGSDGEKVLVSGANGMLYAYTPAGGWSALTSGLSNSLLDVVAVLP